MDEKGTGTTTAPEVMILLNSKSNLMVKKLMTDYSSFDPENRLPIGVLTISLTDDSDEPTKVSSPSLCPLPVTITVRVVLFSDGKLGRMRTLFQIACR